MSKTPRRRCEAKGCIEVALFGPRSTSAERCEKHKLKTDIDHVQRTCVSCNLTWILNSSGVCDSCSAGRSVVHAKEMAVKSWLEASDSMDSTSVRFEAGFITAAHSCTCEWFRLYTMLQDCEGRQMRVVRFNPDSFTHAGASTKSHVGIVRRRQALLSTLHCSLERSFAEHDPQITFQYVCYDGVNESCISPILQCTFI